MSRSRGSSTGNRLLDRLSTKAQESFSPLLESVALKLRKQVHKPGHLFEYVYFPTSAVICTLLGDEQGREAETAAVGSEGMVSVYAVLGLDRSPHQAVCQVEGESLRIPLSAFLGQLERLPEFDRLMRRYVAASLRHAEQTILCNALHPVEERLARWLLLAHDRAKTDDLPMTHEFLAEMLGVRRPTVSLAAGTLQRAGLITYKRGTVRIRQRAALEKAACECYSVMRSFTSRLLENKFSPQ